MILCVGPDRDGSIDLIALVNGQHIFQVKYSLFPCFWYRKPDQSQIEVMRDSTTYNVCILRGDQSRKRQVCGTLETRRQTSLARRVHLQQRRLSVRSFFLRKELWRQRTISSCSFKAERSSERQVCLGNR